MENAGLYNFTLALPGASTRKESIYTGALQPSVLMCRKMVCEVMREEH